MEAGINLRNAEILDAEAIKEIERECGLAPWSIVDYQKEVYRGDTLFYVCEVEGKAVGFILSRLIMTKNLNDNKLGLNSESEIEVYNIGVRKNFRRSGLGRRLIFEVIKAANSLDVKKIWLEVRNSNQAAIDFYNSCGFKIIQKRRGFYSNPIEDGFLMCLSI